MRRHARLPVFAVPLALLAACSGGGSQAQVATATPNVTITAANAVAVAGAAYEAAYMPARLARLVLAFVEVDTPAAPPGGSPAIVTQVVTGPDGGEATFTWNDVDRNGEYTTGDAFTIDFAGYAAAGLTLDGVATLEDVRFDGRPLTSLTWRCDATLRLLDLQYEAGASPAATASGSFAVQREERTIVQVLAAKALGEAAIGPRRVGANSTSGRNEYNIDFEQGFYGDGDFLDPVTGGTFVYETVLTMTGVQFLFDPAFGELRVLGAGGTSVSIVPIDLFNVELKVDGDGDGEAETTLAKEWADL
jgi:hypothetical protein